MKEAERGMTTNTLFMSKLVCGAKIRAHYQIGVCGSASMYLVSSIIARAVFMSIILLSDSRVLYLSAETCRSKRDSAMTAL